MKRSILGLLACLLLASVSFAQQNPADAPASKEDIQRYLDAMHTRDLLKTMMGTMTKQMHKMIHDLVEKQQNLPPDFESRLDTTIDGMFKDFPIDEYLDAVAPVYQKHFTKGDIDALVAFYSSPVGQKVIKELPAIQGDVLQASSGIFQKMMKSAMDRAQEEVAQAQKANDANSSKKPQQN
ncbi:MAG: DUF2059 domain-containing protein [Candidatus Acidiferrales bacterium]